MLPTYERDLKFAFVHLLSWNPLLAADQTRVMQEQMQMQMQMPQDPSKAFKVGNN